VPIDFAIAFLQNRSTEPFPRKGTETQRPPKAIAAAASLSSTEPFPRKGTETLL